MRQVTGYALAVFLFVSACADEPPLASPLKIDLREVVATGQVEPVGGITPAGQPDAEALKVFAENGYEAVIDLRMPSENRGMDEPAVVEDLGMSYVPMPIGADDITFESAAALDELLAGFDGPVLLHCGSSNRVGALLALRASAKGMDDEAAVELGRRAGMTGLEPAVRKALAEK